MAGITGPASVFEGKFGFFETHLTPISGELDWMTPVAGLGTHWYMSDTAYKPYPCCQLLHAFIEGAKATLVELKRDELSPQAITRMSARLAEPGLTLVTDPIERKRAPEHPHEARFSLPFTLASALLHGDVDMETFRPERLKDPHIRRLAALVETGDDPESDYPLHCPALLEIEAGGRLYKRRVRFHPGCPEAPLSHDAVLDKFKRNTTWFLGPSAREIGASLAEVTENVPAQMLIRKFAAPPAAERSRATA